MASFVMKVLNSSFSVTRTVTDTTANTEANSNSLRVAVDGSGNARLVAYTRVNGPSIGYLANHYYFPVAHFYSCATADTTFTKIGQIPYVKEASVPFYVANSGRWYVNLVSFRDGTTLTQSSLRAGVCSYVVDISSSVVTTTPSRFRPAAVLGEYVPDSAFTHSHDEYGYFRDNKIPAHRPHTSGYNTYIGYGQITTYGLRNYAVAKMKLFDASATHFAGNVTCMGVPSKYDSYSAFGLGMVNQPSIHVVDDQRGTLANGTYTYIAVHQFLDREGNIVYSRCSEPISITTTNALGRPLIDVSVPAVTNYDGPVTISLYRTQTAGSTYYLLDSRNVSTTEDITLGIATPCVESFTDTTTDANLISKPLLFRQPGTVGTPLDRCNGLSGKHVIRYKDRFLLAHNNTVFYTSFDVDGDSPWFSPGLSFDVIGGSGFITGLASMDGTIFIFKKDSVFLVDGDGPPENGGTGTEFSTPRKVHTNYGCTDPRSIVEIPDGIVYRSARGIELLTRSSYKNQWLGERVQATVDLFPYVGGATFNQNTGRLYITLASTLDSDGGHTRSSDGYTIVFDTVSNAWTKHAYTNSWAYGKAMQDVIYAGAKVSGNSLEAGMFFADHGAQTFYEKEGSGLDSTGTFVPWTLATGWIRAGSKQDRILVTDLQFLGRRLSGHNLKCQYLYDFNRGSATTIKTFDATATNLTPEQLEFQPSRESVQSMKFLLTSETPTNPTTLGTGEQVEINGITVRVGYKGGGPKLGQTQKG